MIQKVIFIFVLAGLLSQGISCKEPEEKIPPGIIPVDSMVTVITELHLLEARLLVSANRHLEAKEKGAYLADMFQRTGLDTARFSASFDYYSNHPQLFSDIYEKVITEISRRQAENK